MGVGRGTDVQGLRREEVELVSEATMVWMSEEGARGVSVGRGYKGVGCRPRESMVWVSSEEGTTVLASEDGTMVWVSEDGLGICCGLSGGKDAGHE